MVLALCDSQVFPHFEALLIAVYSFLTRYFIKGPMVIHHFSDYFQSSFSVWISPTEPGVINEGAVRGSPLTHIPGKNCCTVTIFCTFQQDKIFRKFISNSTSKINPIPSTNLKLPYHYCPIIIIFLFSRAVNESPVSLSNGTNILDIINTLDFHGLLCRSINYPDSEPTLDQEFVLDAPAGWMTTHAQKGGPYSHLLLEDRVYLPVNRCPRIRK